MWREFLRSCYYNNIYCNTFCVLVIVIITVSTTRTNIEYDRVKFMFFIVEIEHDLHINSPVF